MTPQQEYLLTLIKEIDAICKRHGIVYWLAGGSLIGAVRHGGFLPWDDDADLYMTREMWERFAKACETELPAGRILQSPELDPSYTNTFPRYTSVDYVTVHAHQSLDTEFVGEVIDIFVLDPMKYDPDTFAAYTHDLMLYSDLLNYSGVFGRRFGVPAREFVAWRAKQAVRGRAWVHEQFERRLAGYLDEDGDVYVMRWGGNPFVFDRAWFAESRPIMFEDVQAWAPCGVDQYLTFQYGYEWYQIPSVAEAASHDTGSSMRVRPSEAHELCSKVRKQRTLPFFLDVRKAYMLYDAPRAYARLDERVALEASLVACDVEAAWRCGGEDAVEALERLISWQCSARAAGRIDWNGVYRYNHPVVAPVDDELYTLAALRAFDTERTSKAERMLELREAECGLTPEAADALEAVRSLRDARLELQAGDARTAADRARDVYERYPQCLSACKLTLFSLRAAEGAGGEGAGTAEGAGGSAARAHADADALLEEAVRRFPDDGDLMFLQAERACVRGARDEAQALLREACERTSNGLVLKQIAPLLDDEESRETLAAYRAGKRPVDVTPHPGAADRRRAQVYLRLFTQAHALLEQLGARYTIAPSLAFYLEHADLCDGSVPVRRTVWELFVYPADLLKLVRALDEGAVSLPAGTTYEYMGASARYPLLNLRLVDTGSSDYSIGRDFEHDARGMSIALTPLRPERRGDRARTELRRWRNSCLPRSMKKAGLSGLRGFGLFRPVRGAEARMKRGARVFEDVLRDASGKRVYYLSTKRVTELSGDSLDHPQHLKLGELELPVAREVLERAAGFDVQAVLPKLFAVSDAGISSTYVRHADTPLSQLDGAYYQHMHRQTLGERACTRIRGRFKRTYAHDKNIIAFLDLFARRDELIGADGLLVEAVEEDEARAFIRSVERMGDTLERNDELHLDPERQAFFEAACRAAAAKREQLEQIDRSRAVDEGTGE